MVEINIMKNRKLGILYILSAAIYAVQGFEGVPSLPLFAYLKEHLHFSPEKIMYISSLITIPWLIKPLFGVCIDLWFTKKIWISVSLIGSISISLFFGLSSFLTVSLIIIASTLGSYFTATRDIANDGLACIEGKASNTCDIFQNVQWTAITLAGIITSLAGGYIADNFSYKLAYLLLIPIYLIIIGIVLRYRTNEPKDRTSITLRRDRIYCIGKNAFFSQLYQDILSYKNLFAHKSFIVGCTFIFLFNFNPSFYTVLSFIERDQFKWSFSFMGILGAIASIISIIGSIIYYKYSRRLNIYKVLYYSVFIGALTTMAYMVFTPVTAIIYSCVFSLIGMFIFLNIMTLMARMTINGKESTSFALLCAISNLAGFCSTITGAWLFPKIGLQPLIVLSALTSFLCLPIIKYIKIGEQK